MPNHKATWKSLRQDKVRHERNVAEKSRLRTAVKKVRTSSTEGNDEAATADYQKAISLLTRRPNGT
jgi:ribosomal protein S20